MNVINYMRSLSDVSSPGSPGAPVYTPYDDPQMLQLGLLEYGDFEKFVVMEERDSAVVIKVYDGDTVTLGFKHPGSGKPARVSCRIRGIDTPEMRGGSDYEKDLAVQARNRLDEVTLGKVVTVCSPDYDKYGRLLCDLRTSKIDSISGYMLKAPHICRPYDGGKKAPWVRASSV